MILLSACGGSRVGSVEGLSGLLLRYLLRYMVVRNCGDTDDSVPTHLVGTNTTFDERNGLDLIGPIRKFTNGPRGHLRAGACGARNFTACSCSPGRVGVGFRIPLVLD